MTGDQSGTILVGSGLEIRRVPDDAFVQGIKGLPSRMEARLAFMTRHHHVVRDFVVSRDATTAQADLAAADLARHGSRFTEGICDPFGFGEAFVLSRARFQSECELGFPGDDLLHTA